MEEWMRNQWIFYNSHQTEEIQYLNSINKTFLVSSIFSWDSPEIHFSISTNLSRKSLTIHFMSQIVYFDILLLFSMSFIQYADKFSIIFFLAIFLFTLSTHKRNLLIFYEECLVSFSCFWVHFSNIYDATLIL